MKNLLLLTFLLMSVVGFSQEVSEQDSVTKETEEQEAEKKVKKWNDRNDANYNNNWSFGFGFNTVNMSSNSKDLFDHDNRAFSKNPFYLSAEYYLNNQFSIEGTLSFNNFSEGTKIVGKTVLKGSEANYIAADLALKYSLGELLKLNALEPYVFVGAGNSHVGTYRTEESPEVQVNQKNIFTFNAGIGMNYWFSSSWALNLNGTAKWASASGNANHLQASIGAVYSLN